MARQRRAGGGIDRLPSGRYRVRIVTLDGRRLSLGSYATKRAAEVAYARSVSNQADGIPAGRALTCEHTDPGRLRAEVGRRTIDQSRRRASPARS